MDDSTDPPAADAASEAARPTALGGLGQLFVFLAEGARAFFEFWLPRKYAAPEAVVEGEPSRQQASSPDRAADVIEDLARKLAPYPGQEG